MKVEVNLEKRWAVGIIISVLILAGAIFVYAQWVPPTVWHDESAVKVTVGAANTEKSLGDAINSDICQKDGANWLNCPSGSGGGGDGIGGTVQFYEGFLMGSRPIGIHAYCALSKASWSGSINCKCEVTGSKGGNWNLISTRCDSGGTVECGAVCINLP